MLVILFAFCFISVFIITGINSNQQTGIREIAIKGTLFFSLIVLIVTEIFSLLTIIDRVTVISFWTVFSAINVGYLFTKRATIAIFVDKIKNRISSIYAHLKGTDKFFCLMMLVLLAVLLFQGIIYPPNNIDSLSYHMARLAYWISHHSLMPYPAHIIRQLYQPPLAEMLILHINLLNGADYFSDTVQFVSLTLCLITLSLIIKSFGLSGRIQILGCVLAITIPEVLLQASSTQNDVVISFFILAVLYFTLKYRKSQSLADIFFVGLAVALSLLTKGTGYIFTAPILLFFGFNVLFSVLKSKQYKVLVYGILLVVVMPAVLNSGHFYRNYSYDKLILGVDKDESTLYSVKRMSPKLFISNSAKNFGSHIGFLATRNVAQFGNKLLRKFHSIIGVDLNEPDISYPEDKSVPGGTSYSTPLIANHEDIAPNPLHLLLIITTFILIIIYLIKKRNVPLNVKIVTLVVALQVILYCGILRWQPWTTRLHTTMFLLAMPLVCWVASESRAFKKTVYCVIIPIFLLYGFLTTISNYTRPLVRSIITAKISPRNSRYEKYFSLSISKPTICHEYEKIMDDIEKYKFKRIGVILTTYDWEYPLFYNCYTSDIQPVDIFVKNSSRLIPFNSEGVDCIISTTTNKPFIDYGGKRFYNKNPHNKIIYLYE